ncbi:hypothetical protein AC1031_021205 [Aphanomyces cochlioides]|nr:hypothetical protein AC1031_021205 [Aphanomyces cochlioides]
MMSRDTSKAYRAMKQLEKELTCTNECDCAAWLRSLLVLSRSTLGYNFMLLRRCIDGSFLDSDSSDGDDDGQDSLADWMFQGLVEQNDSLLEISRQFSVNTTAFHESALFEWLQLVHALVLKAHDVFPLMAWSNVMLPLLGESSEVAQFNQVELLSTLVDVAGALQDKPDGPPFAALVSSWLFGPLPFPVAQAFSSDNTSIGVGYFIGHACLPYAQQWLRLLFHVLVIDPSVADSSWPFPALAPSCFRQSLLKIAAEEDDVLVDLAHACLRFCTQQNLVQNATTAMATILRKECAPALIFADFCAAINDDHLVLIDLLSSDETNALAYLVDIFRYICSNWPICASLWRAHGRLDDVMTLRLRASFDSTFDRYCVVLK